MNKKIFLLVIMTISLVSGLAEANFSQAFIAPSVYLTEFNLNSSDNYFGQGDVIEGNFVAWNSEDYIVPDIIYKFSLIKDEPLTTEEIIIDEKLSNEILILYPNGKQKSSFSYSLPQNIMSGVYKFRVELITQKGLPLGWDDVLINIKGNDNFLYLGKAKIIKNGLEEHPTAGSGFEKNETVEIKFEAKNPSANSITARCQIIVYERMTNMLEISRIQKETVTFTSNEKKNFQYKMPVFKKPESYLAEVKFYDNQNKEISNSLYFRWVVQGVSAEILSLKSYKTTYLTGDKAKVEMDLVGSADTITPIGQGEIKIEIYDQENQIVGTTSKNLDLNKADSVTFDVPIAKDVAHPRIEATIVQDGITLDNYAANITPIQEPLIEKEKSKLPLYLLITLILGLILFFLYKKRLQSRPRPLWVLLFLTFTISGLLFSNVNSSYAAKEVYEQACNSRYIGISWNKPIREKTFLPGEPITFSGKVYVPACMDALLNNTIRFYITTEPAPAEPIIRNECVESEESKNIRESILSREKTIQLGQIFHEGRAVHGPVEYNETFIFPSGFYGKVYAMVYFDGYHWGRETNHYRIIAQEEIFTIPSPPAGLHYNSPFCTTINLSWNPNPPLEEVDEYKIFRDNRDITPYEYLATNFSDFGLLPETEYPYFVKAHNRAGWSGPSDILLAKTISCPLNLTVLSYTCDVVVLGWDEVPGAAYYKLYRTKEPPNYGIPIYVGLATTYEDRMHFESGQTYYYRLEVYNANNHLGSSEEIDLIPCPSLPEWEEVHPRWKQ